MACAVDSNPSREPISYRVDTSKEARPTIRRSGQVLPSSRGICSGIGCDRSRVRFISFISVDQCSSALPSAPAPVSDRTSISAALFSKCSLLLIVPKNPSRNDAGMDTSPGLESGNQDQSALGNMELEVPDNAGEKAISVMVMMSPP